MAAAGEFSYANRWQVLKGSAFRVACLGATTVGLVALSALLGIVTWDALGFGAADAEWLLVVLVASAGSTALVGQAVRRHPAVRGAAVSMTAALLGGGLVGAFAVVFLLIVTPYVWFAYAVAAILPAGAVFAAVGSRRRRVPLAATTFVVGAAAATVALPRLTRIAALAEPWLIYYATIVLPLAASCGFAARSAGGPRRATAAAGAVAIAGLVVPLTVPAPAPLDPGLVQVFAICLGFPAGVLTWRRLRDDTGVLGLGAPFAVVAGVALGVHVATAAGFAPPEPWLDWQFLTSPHSRFPEEAGLYPAIVGSFFLMIVMSVFAFPVSVGAAIYLEEYAPSAGWRGRGVRLIQVNVANLAGVPSVVYGLLGLAIIARTLQLGVGAVTTAGLTVGLLVMPITVISAQEAIRAVPDDRRMASYAMGASDWQTLRTVVLPEALPGILTGTILSLGRAIGETAPLIMVGAATTVYSPPTSLGGSATAMPMQIFAWAGEFIAEFRTGVLSAGVLALLLVMLGLNAVAILLRNRYERPG